MAVTQPTKQPIGLPKDNKWWCEYRLILVFCCETVTIETPRLFVLFVYIFECIAAINGKTQPTSSSTLWNDYSNQFWANSYHATLAYSENKFSGISAVNFNSFMFSWEQKKNVFFLSHIPVISGKSSTSYGNVLQFVEIQSCCLKYLARFAIEMNVFAVLCKCSKLFPLKYFSLLCSIHANIGKSRPTAHFALLATGEF